MSEPPPTKIENYLTNNVIKMYYELDEAMVDAKKDGNTEFANSTARSLLNNSDLPLIIRARACMMIACSDEPDALDMAEEAVRIAELGISLCSSPTDDEKQLLEDCKSVLAQAQAYDEYKKGDEQEGDELVWHADWDKDTGGGGPA